MTTDEHTMAFLTNGQDKQLYETGCYIDGHWGQYGIIRLIELCDAYLSTDLMAQLPQADIPDTHSPYPAINNEDPNLWETIVDISDEAETKLNEATEDGFSWGWHDGEFFLWNDATWEEDE